MNHGYGQCFLVHFRTSFLNQPECIYLLQAKGLAVSKREAKEEGGKRADFKQPRSKNLS